MFGSFKGDERIVQTLRLPVGLALPPAGGMPGESVNKLVMSNILRTLVGVSTARSRRADQSQANGVVVRFVRSVLAIGQDGDAELAVHIGQVNPLVRRHFKPLRLGGWPLDRANVPVVGCHLIRSCQWETRLQVGLFGIPVDCVCEFHALTRIPGRKADGLDESGSRGLP